MPSVKPVQIRFSAAVDAAMRREAEREGVTIAQFVREAVVARIAWLEAQRANGVEDANAPRSGHEGEGGSSVE